VNSLRGEGVGEVDEQGLQRFRDGQVRYFDDSEVDAAWHWLEAMA